MLSVRGRWALNADPADFLTLIRNAKYVITDSFHGAVFSLMFHKDFCLLERIKNDKVSPMNVRLYDLLEMVGLEDHIQHDAAGVAAVLQKHIDFAAVDAKLAARAEQSRDYLRRALGEESAQ